jgi:hypothetical protein
MEQEQTSDNKPETPDSPHEIDGNGFISRGKDQRPPGFAEGLRRGEQTQDDFWPQGEIGKIVGLLELAGFSKQEIYEELVLGPDILDKYWCIVLLGEPGMQRKNIRQKGEQ